ncbi:MAG: Lacal_2735 family protein [Saprospiraceae bacterium]
MFGLFKKDPVKKLQKKYKDLMEESYRLSTTDRKASDLKRAEAEEVIKEIEALQKKS